MPFLENDDTSVANVESKLFVKYVCTIIKGLMISKLCVFVLVPLTMNCNSIDNTTFYIYKLSIQTTYLNNLFRCSLFHRLLN